MKRIYLDIVFAMLITRNCDAMTTTPALPSGYVQCSVENGLCAVGFGSSVIFGATGGFSQPVYSTKAVACNWAAFGGDPKPGTVKACYVSSDAPVALPISGLPLDYGSWKCTPAPDAQYMNWSKPADGCVVGSALYRTYSMYDGRAFTEAHCTALAGGFEFYWSTVWQAGQGDAVSRAASLVWPPMPAASAP